MTRRGITRAIAVLALTTAIGTGVYVAHRLAEGGAATSACPGNAFGWQGRITGVELASSHPVVERQVVVLINQFRDENHLPPLTTSPALGYAARYHSSDMHAKHYFAHERAGETFTERFARYSPSRCVAENIAWGTAGFSKAAGIVSLWRASPGHRHVMLLPWIHRVGVGVIGGTFFGSRGARITTADFSG